MNMTISPWYSIGGAALIDVDQERLVSPSPALSQDIASDDQPTISWPDFAGGRAPKTVFIRDLHDSRLDMQDPIPASLEFSEGQVSACCYDLEQFGIGNDEFEALDDLRATIVELYFALKGEPRLGPLPERQLSYLRRALRER